MGNNNDGKNDFYDFFKSLSLNVILKSINFSHFNRQPNKMVKHIQTIYRLLTTNCLSALDHFVGLPLGRVKQKVSPQLNQTEIELFEGYLTETEQLTSIKNIVHNWFPVNDGLTVIFVALRIRKKIDRHIVVDLLKNKGGISSANFC